MLSPFSKRLISRVRTQVRPKTSSQRSTILSPSTSSHKPFHSSQSSSTLDNKSEAKQVSPKPTANMPSYIVTLKEDATDDQLAAAKQQAKDQGGQIGHEYGLIKGFQVIFPEGTVHSLDSNEHVKAVEADGEVRIQ